MAEAMHFTSDEQEGKLIHLPKSELKKREVDKILSEPGLPIAEKRKEPQYSDLLVFGAGVDEKSSDLLSDGAKMRVLAALELWRRGEVNQIIFSGGKTNLKIDISEAEAMKRYFLKMFRIDLNASNLPSEQVEENLAETETKLKKEDRATNTLENIAQTMEIFNHDQIDNQQAHSNIAGLSTHFHGARIKEILKMFDIDSFIFDEEYLLQMRNPQFRDITEKFRNNPSYEKILFSENRWMRGLEEEPDYYLQAFGLIEDNNLFRQAILKLIQSHPARQNIKTRLEELGVVNVETIEPTELRQIIKSIIRIKPSESWASPEDWHK